MRRKPRRRRKSASSSSRPRMYPCPSNSPAASPASASSRSAPRSSGILLKREYLEGAVVDVGQVLFRIDPRTYEAALARANAQAAQAKATLIQAEENYKRQEGLAAQKVATQKSLEDAIAARDQARAAIAIDRGRRRRRRSSTWNSPSIKAPVKGPTSLVSPAEGTLIQAQQTRCSPRSPSSIRPTSTSPSPTASCAPCRRSTGRARSCSIPRTSRSSCSSAMAPPIPSPARWTRARARSIRGPAPS